MTNHAVSNRADLRERTKTMSRHGDRRGQIADFRDSFETINWLYLLFKCGIKTKTHSEWLLWHWSSLGQLNLEPTRPNGLVGCKVPTDLVKISVKEATHMGFHYGNHCPCGVVVSMQDASWSKTENMQQPCGFALIREGIFSDTLLPKSMHTVYALLCFVMVWWDWIYPYPPGPLLTKRTDVLPQNLVKSRNSEIRG